MAGDTYKISVVIPTYNRSALLVRALRSVLLQTYPVHEIIVCDDGSADDSRQQVEALGSPVVKWLDCGRNGRPAIPRNKGIEKATGDWIAFLDSDDEWKPEKLAKQVEALERSNGKASGTNALRRKPGEAESPYFEAVPSGLLTLQVLVSCNYVICSSVLCRRDLLVQCGLFPESAEVKALEDYVMWLKVSAKAPFIYLGEPLVMYDDDASVSIRMESETAVQQRIRIFNYLKTCKMYFSREQIRLVYRIFKYQYKSFLNRMFDWEGWTL